ncbi:hypothetical protein [Paraburkholderia caribensis]|uniref:hypothetical protein n=1 Tax=Paraburkholderia caribensis TaxID=75105 RepID=UPI0011E05674|nr:hypothetical protein [Paraburkholderia caribensis]
MRTDKMPQSNANAAIHAHCMNGRVAMMAVELSLRQVMMPSAVSTKSFKRPPDAPVRATHAIGANLARMPARDSVYPMRQPFLNYCPFSNIKS